MPEYLAPGVYVEETSFRSKSIEGVSTTTTGFIGPARYGPIDLVPDVITSLGEFERMYGDRQRLEFFVPGSADAPPLMHNYLWHAARAFFEEGGKRLYVARAFSPLKGDYPPDDFNKVGKNNQGLFDDGHARAAIPAAGGDNSLQILARFPGATGSEMRVRLTAGLGQNVLGREPVLDSQGKTVPNKFKPKVSGLLDNDVVWISDVTPTSPPASPPAPKRGDYYLAESYFNTKTKEWTWRFNASTTSPPLAMVTSPPAQTVELANLNFEGDGDEVRLVTLTVTVVLGDGTTQVWSDLPLDPLHERAAVPDSLFAKFSLGAGSLSQALRLPVMITRGAGVSDGLDVLNALFSGTNLRQQLDDPQAAEPQRSIIVELVGGNDGQRPQATQYEGQADENKQTKTGLKIFENIDDISIVAAPGSTFDFEDPHYKPQAESIVNLLSSHAERMRYRIAVLDSGDGQAVSDVRAMRARLDSKYAALYYPWITILDPVTQREIIVPPSGAVAGIYARNDIQRAVYKAPANEVVNTAIGFEVLLNKAQQDVLNPEGVNCFRYFPGRGLRLWGARTISSDPEWKYVNLRRYFAYLEHSIDKGTQWAVFEPNGELLWGNVRRTIEDFLLNEWQSGALLGDKPEKAYFVKCDRSTMTQNDLDNGRLVCLIGVAPLRPAEFVIFRIGQWTADRKV